MHYNFNYLIRYPFSNLAKEYLKEKDINLFSVSDDIVKKATLFLLKTINQDVQENEMQWKNNLKIDDERISSLFVKLFPIYRILLNIVDYNPLYQQFGNYFQKQLKFYLTISLDSEEFNIIQKDICPNLIYKQETNQYFIPLIEYLEYNLGDDFKLQYANLDEGNIYFTKLEVIDLLGAILKKRILKNIEMSKKDFPKLFLEYGAALKDKIIKENAYNIKIINKPQINQFPPCFEIMYNKLISRQKLTHIENFTLAVFLFNVGYSYDEILNLYKNLPNFDEKIAGYQIKKIIEKEYSVPNCSTLKSNGLCVTKCNVKHPFQLFKFKKGEDK